MRIQTPTSHIGLAASGGGLNGRVRFWWQRGWLPMLLIGAATFWAYGLCLNGEFVWDDDAWTVKLADLLQSFSGLATMWLHVTVLQQYYPLTGTTFWLDYQLWGFWTPAYHIENVLLHLLNAMLSWRLLRRLAVPGAGLGEGLSSARGRWMMRWRTFARRSNFAPTPRTRITTWTTLCT